MKIALIDPSLFTWPYDSALAGGLLQNGHEPFVFGKHLSEDEPEKSSPQLRELFYPGFQKDWMQNLPRPVFLALKGITHFFSLINLRRKLRKLRPDIIHFQWTPLPVIDQFFIASFRRIAPTILTVHDSTPFNGNPRSGLQRLNAVSVMHRFDRLIVHTEEARQRLIAYGLPTGRLARIPHGILEPETTAAFLPAPPAQREDHPVTILLFGKLKPYKGVDILIRALGALPAATRAQCRLRIVGKPYMELEPLTALAKELGVENNIVWDLRFVADEALAGLFSDADILAMPYRDIDASGVLTMALAAGRPVVASRIGLFSEILRDGIHGYLIPPEDPAALAAALAELIGNREKRLAMGEQVRLLRAMMPTWQQIARMTEELYLETKNAGARAA